MVASLDEMVGKIVAAVDATGQWSNTLFIFSSDNGGPRPGVITSNGPLRAGKGTVYEGGVHTCAFVTWDNHIKSGSTVNALSHMVDWYPTLLTLTGASLKQKLPLDGRDIWPCITQGKKSPHEEILCNAAPQSGAIRVGDWKLVINGQQRDFDEEGSGAVGSDSTPTVKGKGKRKSQGATVGEKFELFDLAKDPSEKINLAQSEPDKVKELRKRYDVYAQAAVPPKSRGRDNAPPTR
jgi:arylsulfatase I/J